MNATYIVTFKGFSEKAADRLEAWLREDIAFYPKRMRMESATVAEQKPSIRSQSIARRKAQKEQANAKS